MGSLKGVQDERMHPGAGNNFEFGDNLSHPSYQLGSDTFSSKIKGSLSTVTSLHTLKITPQKLKEIAAELGIIRLCWPESSAHDRKYYPSSYHENNSKEKLLLWYTENFRQQFHYHLPQRRPLLLAADNECGLQEIMRNVLQKKKIAQQMGSAEEKS